MLAAPDVRSVSFGAPGPIPPGSGNKTGNSEMIGEGTTSRGLLIGDVGQITGRVELTSLAVGARMGDRKTLSLPGTYVGVPGNADSQEPQLAWPAVVRTPHGFRAAEGVTGQGTSAIDTSGSRGRLAVLVRCYGDGPVRLTYQMRRTVTSLGSVACDNGVHELRTALRLKPSGRQFVTVHASKLTSYRVFIGTVGG